MMLVMMVVLEEAEDVGCRVVGICVPGTIVECETLRVLVGNRRV